MGSLPHCTGGVWPINHVSIAIVGLGSMGRVYLQCFRRMENVSVCAIVSSSAKPEEFSVYSTLEALFKSEQPNIVCICTPTYLHVQQARIALQHGCHVICEKPLALHRADAEALYELATKQKRYLFAAQVVRFASSTEWLRDAVYSGRYGTVREAFFSRLSTMPHWCTGNWAFDHTYSGHVPFDLHIHDLDLIVSLFGPPLHATCEESGASELPFDEHFWFTYEYEDFTIRAEAAWYRASIPFKATWRVAFENALALCSDGTVTVYEKNAPPFTIREGYAYATGFSVPATDMYDKELRYFVQCCLFDEIPILLPAEEILTVLGILETLQNKA